MARLTLPESVRHFLMAHGTMTLATANDKQPWAAAVYYVPDEVLDLYFISDPGARHVREGLAAGEVAVAIHGSHQDWRRIAGVQLAGRLSEVSAPERPRVEHLYLTRFTDVAWHVRHAGAGSRMVEKFRASRFYRVSPRFLRFIDNTAGFGQAEEFGRDA